MCVSSLAAAGRTNGKIAAARVWSDRVVDTPSLQHLRENMCNDTGDLPETGPQPEPTATGPGDLPETGPQPEPTAEAAKPKPLPPPPPPVEVPIELVIYSAEEESAAAAAVVDALSVLAEQPQSTAVVKSSVTFPVALTDIQEGSPERANFEADFKQAMAEEIAGGSVFDGTKIIIDQIVAARRRRQRRRLQTGSSSAVEVEWHVEIPARVITEVANL